MTATLASAIRPAAAPSGLLRRVPPVVVAEPARPMALTIAGVLLEDAQMRVERATGRPTIVLTVANGVPNDPALRVVEIYGDDRQATHHVADAKARRLTAGTRVTVRGEGLRTTWDRGERFYRLALVQSVEVAA